MSMHVRLLPTLSSLVFLTQPVKPYLLACFSVNDLVVAVSDLASYWRWFKHGGLPEVNTLNRTVNLECNSCLRHGRGCALSITVMWFGLTNVWQVRFKIKIMVSSQQSFTMIDLMHQVRRSFPGPFNQPWRKNLEVQWDHATVIDVLAPYCAFSRAHYLYTAVLLECPSSATIPADNSYCCRRQPLPWIAKQQCCRAPKLTNLTP